MATSQRSLFASRSLAEVYGLAASAEMTQHVRGSSSSQQLRSSIVWSVSTLPGWWESPTIQNAVDKQAQAAFSVLIAEHENIQLRRYLCNFQQRRKVTERELRSVRFASMASRLRVKELVISNNNLNQALAEKDIALAKQREEADDMVTEWKGRLLAAQATAQERADELEGQLHATRTEADQLRLSSAQQAATIATQEQELKQTKLQAAQLELQIAELHSQAAQSQRIEAAASQQAKQAPPEIAGSEAEHQDMEQGRAGFIKAHHPQSMVCDDEEATGRAPAGPDDHQPAAASEMVSSRGCEGGASSSLVASRPESPPLQVCDEEEARARAPAGPDDGQPATTSEVMQSRFGEEGASGSFVTSPSAPPSLTEQELKQTKLQAAQLELQIAELHTQAAQSQRIEAAASQQAKQEPPEMAGSEARHEDVEQGSAGFIKAYHPQSSMIFDEEEARARAPAGPDDDQPAAASEVVNPTGCEGGANSSLAASRPASPLLKVCDEEEARARAPAGPDEDQPAATTEVMQSRVGEEGASGSIVASPSASPCLTAAIEVKTGSKLAAASIVHESVLQRPLPVAKFKGFRDLVLTSHGTAAAAVPVMDKPKSSSAKKPRDSHTRRAALRFFRDLAKEAEAATGPFCMECSHMASGDMEMRMRAKRGLAPDQDATWTYQPSEFSPAVRVLVTDAEQTVLGQGINGTVSYGEMLQSDNSIKPCAIKTVAYGDKTKTETDTKVQLELVALQAALGVPNVVQCLGVFRHTPRRQPARLVIVTEYIPGEDLNVAVQTLNKGKKEEDEDDVEDLFACKWAISKEILAGVQGLHLQGRAHCDLKPQNIRVLLGKDRQVLQCTLCDLGGSVAYDGPYAGIPPNFATSQDFASPEVCQIVAKLAPGSGHVSAMAHDIWSLGYLMYWLLTGKVYFTTQVEEWEAVCKAQDVWASTYAIPRDKLGSDDHDIIDGLWECDCTDEEVDEMIDVVRHMLHPDARARATISEVVQSPFFAHR